MYNFLYFLTMKLAMCVDYLHNIEQTIVLRLYKIFDKIQLNIYIKSVLWIRIEL